MVESTIDNNKLFNIRATLYFQGGCQQFKMFIVAPNMNIAKEVFKNNKRIFSFLKKAKRIIWSSKLISDNPEVRFKIKRAKNGKKNKESTINEEKNK